MDSSEDYNNLFNRLRAKFQQIISFHSDINRRNEWITYANAIANFYKNQLNIKNQQLLENVSGIFDFVFKDGNNRPTEHFDIFLKLDYTDPIVIKFIGDLLRN